jgi:hypothetical protein
MKNPETIANIGDRYSDLFEIFVSNFPYYSENEDIEYYYSLKHSDFHDREELDDMRRQEGYDPKTCRVVANDNNALGFEHGRQRVTATSDAREQVREGRGSESQAPPALSGEAEKALNNRKFNRQIKNSISLRTYMEAVKLVDRGFACVPVHSLDGDGHCTCEWKRKRDAATYCEEFEPKCQAPGKHPKLPKWQDRAGTTLDRIQHWFSEKGNQYGPANLGIVTGKDKGVLVIDVDGPEGIASIARLEYEWGPLPATVTSVTGSGGRHILFRYPDDWDIRNSASMLGGKGSKVDIRGENGFIVAPGSLHRSGNRYEWLEGHSPDDLVLAALPQRWLEEAYAVTKAHQTEAEAKIASEGRGGTHPTKPKKSTSKISTMSFDDIGDYEGGSGFNTPINSILCSFFAKHGPEADCAEIRQEISDHVEGLIAASLVDKSRGREAYTIKGGKLDMIIASAREFVRRNANSGSSTGKLVALNNRFGVVKVGGAVKIVDIDDKDGYSFMTQTDFRLLLSNRWIQVDENKRPIADEWLKWPGRRDFEGVEFAPGGGREGYLNLFTGFAYEPKRGGESHGDGWSLLEAHIFENMCHGNIEWYDWLMTWFADIVQNPETKRGSCVIVRGEQGVGKSIVFDLFRQLLGGAAVKVDSIERLTGRFNSCLSAKVLAHLDEGMWAGNKADQSKMKNLITASSMYIERKGLEGWEEPNFVRVAITSNDHWLMSMTKDDRRNFVLECKDTHQNDTLYFKAMVDEMKNGGFEAWMYDLMRGGSVCLNSFGRFSKWISASIMPPPSLMPAR